VVSHKNTFFVIAIVALSEVEFVVVYLPENKCFIFSKFFVVVGASNTPMLY